MPRRTLHPFLFLAAVLSLTIVPGVARAEVFFDTQLPADEVTDWGFNDVAYDQQRLAEDVLLGEPATLRSLSFLGGYFDGPVAANDTFAVKVFADADGLPDPNNVLAERSLQSVQRSGPVGTYFHRDIYAYSADLEAVSLDAGTPYWLTLVNDTTGQASGTWCWAGSSSGGVYAYSGWLDVDWVWTPSGRFALSLSDRLTAPGPGDATRDGTVDVGDLGVLAGHWGITQGAIWDDGDFNADGRVDVGDLGILAGHWGDGNAVPEPLSLVVFGALGVAGCFRRR
jgi:hypothetical protein